MVERKKRLKGDHSERQTHRLQLSPHGGKQLFAEAEGTGLEGLMSKALTHVPSQPATWDKSHNTEVEEHEEKGCSKVKAPPGRSEAFL
jgi:ATP-dependent DNA ligase